MDEYRKLPDEFHFNEDEFNQERKTIKQKAKPKSGSKVIKLLCASSMLVMVLPSFYNLYQAPDHASSSNQDISTNNQTANQDNNPGSSIDNQGNATGDDVTNLKEIVCPDCEGVGFICPGDPNFGYDRGNGYGYEGCHGTGFSTCPDIWCHNGIKTCQDCKGSGTKDGESCESCHGTGIVDCEFCFNTGIAECICKDSHYDCPTCGGTGHIYIEEE